MIRSTYSITACIFAISVCAIASADTITLKSAARHLGDTNIILLGDVAVLEGDDVQRLAAVQVGAMKSSGKTVEIAVSDVRKALDAAGVNWARVHLSGRSVIVRPTRDAATLPPQAMTASAIDGGDAAHDAAAPTPKEEPAVGLDTLINTPTVAGSIANLIITNLRVNPSEIRVRFAPQDGELLSLPLTSARFEVQPLGSLAGDRLAFAVRTWNGTEAVNRGQIALVAQRLMLVSRATRDLSRSEIIDDTCLETTSAWLSPSEAMQLASRASIVGRTAARSLNAGEPIRTRDIEREALIKRGQLVTVRCLVGGVAISLQAEARGEGSLGEAIEFRKTGERDAFVATITGPNQAVINLGKS